MGTAARARVRASVEAPLRQLLHRRINVGRARSQSSHSPNAQIPQSGGERGAARLGAQLAAALRDLCVGTVRGLAPCTANIDAPVEQLPKRSFDGSANSCASGSAHLGRSQYRCEIRLSTGLLSASQVAPEFVGAPNDDREGQEESEVCEADRGCPEHAFKWWQVDKRSREDDLGEDAPEQQPVAEEA